MYLVYIMDQYDFTKYISELDTPQVADYEFFTRNETAGYSFEIYRKYAEVRLCNRVDIIEHVRFLRYFGFQFSFVGFSFVFEISL